MAIADSRYRFLMVDIGQCGSESDGGVWSNCSFNHKLQSGRVVAVMQNRVINLFDLFAFHFEYLFDLFVWFAGS